MKMKYTYLIIDIASFIVPFLFSFHPKIKFYRQFKYFWPANLFVTSLFIIWDILFTDLKVWGFNRDYLTGVYFFNLPIEEIMFFIFIPYSCIFTYHCFKILLSDRPALRYEKLISSFLICILLITGVVFAEKIYTFCTFIPLAIFIYLFQFVYKSKWISKYYFAYTILIIPFLIVNGILTGTGIEKPVVWYDEAEILGIRLLTIPVEDFFYGMLLILLNISLMEIFAERSSKHTK